MSHPILKHFFCVDIQLYHYQWNLEELIFHLCCYNNLYVNMENGFRKQKVHVSLWSIWRVKLVNIF